MTPNSATAARHCQPRRSFRCQQVEPFSVVNVCALKPHVMEDSREPRVGHGIDHVVSESGVVQEFIVKKHAIVLQRGSCEEMDTSVEVTFILNGV